MLFDHTGIVKHQPLQGDSCGIERELKARRPEPQVGRHVAGLEGVVDLMLPERADCLAELGKIADGVGFPEQVLEEQQ